MIEDHHPLLPFAELTPNTQRAIRDAIWDAEHPDYRGRSEDGGRTVLVLGPSGGTELWPIDGASARQGAYLRKQGWIYRGDAMVKRPDGTLVKVELRRAGRSSRHALFIAETGHPLEEVPFQDIPPEWDRPAYIRKLCAARLAAGEEV